MYYVNNRWLGGMLTNFRTIQHPYRPPERQLDDDGRATAQFEVLPKKEVIKLTARAARSSRRTWAASAR